MIVLLKRRTNLKNIFQKSIDVYERCCTFDGPIYFSEESQLIGPIAKEIREEVDELIA